MWHSLYSFVEFVVVVNFFLINLSELAKLLSIGTISQVNSNSFSEWVSCKAKINGNQVYKKQVKLSNS